MKMAKATVCSVCDNHNVINHKNVKKRTIHTEQWGRGSEALCCAVLCV